jgi:integrase
MPRKVKDASLDTRAARSRLRTQHKPYYRLIEPGLHLGYRKLPSGPGTWVARRYVGDGRYVVENLRTADGEIVLADDYADADGVRVLRFAQAQRAARGPRVRSAGGLTVGDVVADYLEYLAGDGRSPHALADARSRVAAHILPGLGAVKVAALTTDRLRRWRDDVASAAPRVRTPNGAEQRHRAIVDDDGRRARRASANRVGTLLRAALNHAFNDGKIESDIVWRKVKPFRGVDSARVRYLTVAEARRLVNSCDAELRPLVQAALQTGCRYGELGRLQVQDFNANAGTLAVRQSKTGKSRHVILTDEGAELFAGLVAGRAGHELILRRASGEPWRAANQGRLMAGACERARIKPPIPFHGLRHTWASLAVMAGMPLMVVARNLGHSSTKMVERHYGHLTATYLTDAVRKHAPRFGKVTTNVRSMR